MKSWLQASWIKSVVVPIIGGGLAGAFTAALDPSKYHFPHDFGSGKLWEYFFMGAVLTASGMLAKSQFGQKTEPPPSTPPKPEAK